MERLFQDRGTLLRLATVTLKTLPRVEATALSGFGLLFGVSFRWGHDALLASVWVCGDCSLSTCT
jgi:hypothetical protein